MNQKVICTCLNICARIKDFIVHAQQPDSAFGLADLLEQQLFFAFFFAQDLEPLSPQQFFPQHSLFLQHWQVQLPHPPLHLPQSLSLQQSQCLQQAH